MSLPALESLRTAYTEVWVEGRNVPLIRFADRVRSIAFTGLDLLELGVDDRVRCELARFDRIVSWYGSSREAFRDAVAGLPFTFHRALPGASSLHACDFYLEQVGAPAGAVPVIDTGVSTREPFLAIHPFSGSAVKNWPLESFRALARRSPLPVRFCAGPEEDLDEAVHFESLWDVACWLASATAYVGNDSGITHLAAAVGTPVLACFRSTDPRVWAPRGRAEVRVIERAPSIDDLIAILPPSEPDSRGADRAES